MKIKITSDSASDLTKELYETYNISIEPLTILKDGQPYKDGQEISIYDIFAHVEAGGGLCTTSALNIADYIRLFTPFMEEYDAVIHISIGSGFSSSYQNACLAAEEFSNVYVVDSQNLSAGEGLVALRAAELAREGTHSVEEILAELQDLIPRIDTSFLLDRLDYMVKGGRCSAVAAMGATLLHLHPCIEVSEGKLRVARKYRGSLKKCLVNYVKDRLENTEGLELQRCFVTHSGIDAEISREVQRTVAECQPFESVLETVAGGTVTCHCGNNTLGILYIHSK
ncbi:MAG: DegV family protein [Firmicutes bacterium]|nr:DegV family protein [Bacillota bacterium]